MASKKGEIPVLSQDWPNADDAAGDLRGSGNSFASNKQKSNEGKQEK